MSERLRFSYSRIPARSSLIRVRPLVRLTLEYQETQQEVVELLDSGADISVLPYDIGLALGLDWSSQKLSADLGGNLSRFDTRIVVVSGRVADTRPALLVFGWTKAPNVPLILGQVNFFKRYNVHFYGAEDYFELERRNDNDPSITFME